MCGKTKASYLMTVSSKSDTSSPSYLNTTSSKTNVFISRQMKFGKITINNDDSVPAKVQQLIFQLFEINQRVTWS